MSRIDPTGSVESYRSAILGVLSVAHLIRHLDFAAMIKAIDHADTVGPLLDPTLYRRKQKALLEDRGLLEAAQAFVHEASKFWPPGDL